MPSPITSLSRIAHASPVPAHTTLASDGATASAPIAATGIESDTGFHRMPPSVVFHTPPDAAPAYYVKGSPATPATDAIRLPTTGPTNRNDNASCGPLPKFPRRCAIKPP